MSSQQLELARAILRGWGRGDYSSTDWAHPEIEFGWVDGLSPGTSKGLASMARAWSEFLSQWEDFRSEAEEFQELDEGQILVPVMFTGRATGSGMEIERMGARGACLFDFREGKVTRLLLWWDRRTIEDLDGLPPRDASAS